MTVLSLVEPVPMTDRSRSIERRRRAAGILLLTTLALLTSVALIPARAERVAERTARVSAPATHTPPHC
jgi:hypothetical protein